MQYIIALALFLAILAWLISLYHRLEQLQHIATSKWAIVLESFQRRNTALREFLHQLSSHGGHDQLLRQLRHSESDLELSLSRNIAPKQQRQLIEANEARLLNSIHELLDRAEPQHQQKLQAHYRDILELDQQRILSIRLYNAAVMQYRHQLSQSPQKYVAQLFHLRSMRTIEARSLLN